MMMTVHKLSVSDGYIYLSRQVASGDTVRGRGQGLSDYYLETGNPPGRWMGAGSVDLEVSGQVTEAQMQALFRHGAHPDRQRIVAAHVAAGLSASAGETAARLGRQFQKFSDPGRRAVAGYDLVFGPVKSVSLLWALGGEEVRREVEAAHDEAVANVLAWLEANAVFSRTGHVSRQRVPGRGLICAAFDHRDSRAGDPDLHTHVAVLTCC
jgi:TrwC relaxase